MYPPARHGVRCRGSLGISMNCVTEAKDPPRHPRVHAHSTMSRIDAQAFIFGDVGNGAIELLSKAEQLNFNGATLEREDRAALVRRNRSLNLLALVVGRDAPLSLFILQHVASLMPSALAVHYGFLAGSPLVAPSCMPLPVLFSVPGVGPDAWLSNKRALAFHRCCVGFVYAQGAFSLLKFVRGDLIGGIYDAVMCGTGAYALDPDGIRLMPSYIMICGFNGLLGLVQVLQQFQGAPIHYLPFAVILPPLVACAAAYCGWEFCREIRAIAAGLHGEGCQDSCFVRFMAADWWPASTAPVSVRDGVLTSDGAPFNPFVGDGHRLGTQ